MQNDPSIATKLLQAIIAKAGLEFLLIIGAVSLAAYSHLNPPIRGAIDVAGPQHIAGWAYDPREPNANLEVQLFIDGRFVATRMADEPREDLVTAGAAENAQHGFNFALETPGLTLGKHLVNVYAVRPGGARNKSLLSLTKKTYEFEIKP